MSVNVRTEWGKLREIVVGNSLNFNIKGFDEVFAYLYRDQLELLRGDKKHTPSINRQYTLERQSDLDKFSRLLQRRGITVRRPRQLDRASIIRTPTFSGMVNALDSPRDAFLCLGDEIIETPPTNRNRYFEGLMMRDIFTDYFRQGARWTLAPRPRLTMESLDKTHWTKGKGQRTPERISPELDIAFDAANCLKLGRDLLMNIGNRNHELGAAWLQRHLGKAFRVHTARICDSHVDGSLMPLREGVMLINPNMKGRLGILPPFLRKWKMIEARPGGEKNFNYPPDHRQLASFNGMCVNVLSLDENTVCVRAVDTQLQEQLDREGFTVIPVQLRHCELFGGGLHCATLDVARD